MPRKPRKPRCARKMFVYVQSNLYSIPWLFRDLGDLGRLQAGTQLDDMPRSASPGDVVVIVCLYIHRYIPK